MQTARENAAYATEPAPQPRRDPAVRRTHRGRRGDRQPARPSRPADVLADVSIDVVRGEREVTTDKSTDKDNDSRLETATGKKHTLDQDAGAPSNDKSNQESVAR